MIHTNNSGFQLGNSEAIYPQIMWDWAEGINVSRYKPAILAGITDLLDLRKRGKLRGTRRRRTKNDS